MASSSLAPQPLGYKAVSQSPRSLGAQRSPIVLPRRATIKTAAPRLAMPQADLIDATQIVACQPDVRGGDILR
jgi:hypothetical protein